MAAPVVTLKALLNEHQGKVVVVDFWASWCSPCRKSFPWLNDMQAKYKTQGLVVIGVNLDNQRTLADEFLETSPAKFSIIYDPKGQLAKKLKVKGMPSSYIFNREGKLVGSHVGFFPEKRSDYETKIQQFIF